MTVSLNWLKDYLDFDYTPEQLSEILTAIGLEVEGMDTVETIKGGLEGIVVGHVVDCQKHPNADKLSLTKVNVGGDEDLQIVCGAPNVAKGLKVVVATIGTTLYSPEGEPWKIKKGKIRGELSEGMICAEDELGLGTDHNGIIVIPDEVSVGTLAKDHYNVSSDIVYEIGLTPNRSDATGHLGVAKDVMAYMRVNGYPSAKIKTPDLSGFSSEAGKEIEVEVRDTDACPRYSGLTINNVKIGPAPKWIAERLGVIGVKSISNVVDITNFVLHELGQPLHAFDQDKIGGGKIIVDKLPEGTKFTTLDENERTLSDKDLMICDGTLNPMCIAGVYGGLSSGVTESTTSIFLEAAHFEAIGIRKTSTGHLLRTDAAKCFEKGTDPNITVDALKRAAMLFKEYAGGTISGSIVDIYPNIIEPAKIDLSFAHVRNLIGAPLTNDEIVNILDALEMEVSNRTTEKITVFVPTNKADVTREPDVIEEILRVYGFDNIETPDHHHYQVSHSQKEEGHVGRNAISNYLVGRGFNEMMGLSLSNSQVLEKAEAVNSNEMVFINNTSNIHLNVMRPNLMLSGLESVAHNLNRQQSDLRLFEFGRSYKKAGSGYGEREGLTGFLTGKWSVEHWNTGKAAPVSFYHIKRVAIGVLEKMGVRGLRFDETISANYAYGLSAWSGKYLVAEMGMVSPSKAKEFGIKQAVFAFDIDWSIVSRIKMKAIKVKEVSKFPSIRRDLALVVKDNVSYESMKNIANKIAKNRLEEVDLFDVFKSEEVLGKGMKSYALKFVFSDLEKTMTDKEIEAIMSEMIGSFENDLGAIIRR